MLVHSTVYEQQKTSVEFMKALGLAPNLTMKYFTAKAFYVAMELDVPTNRNFL